MMRHLFGRAADAGPPTRGAAQTIAGSARPIDLSAADFGPLLEMVGGARLVLLGEASHGTHEFYAARAAITRRLIDEHGFAAVVAEADWPDAERVNCFVRAQSDDADADTALGDFRRFPYWMWRNTVVRGFVAWLRRRNDALPPGAPRAGFYGMDLYSLHSSIESVVAYLDRVDPAAAGRARERYACFEHFGDDPQRYGYAAGRGAETCEDDVVSQLLELRQRGPAAVRPGSSAEDELFYAEQNARLVKNAEAYYRSMFRGREESWNLRDTHMAETIDALLAHLDRRHGRVRLVVWAHNSHLGDARATELGAAGELNVGQLMRQRYGRDALLVGFSTYQGEVTAASDWGAPAERRRVRPGLAGSYEALLHEAALLAVGRERAVGGQERSQLSPALLLNLRDDARTADALAEPRLERAIGVVYRPQTERWSHYFRASLPDQFDMLLHVDTTTAVEPLEPGGAWGRGEPETYPSGL